MLISKNVVIVGAGAAGLMCAIEAGKRGRSVVVIEHEEKIGKKILISGGGRCNFTNIHSSPQNFFSQNHHFCKSALARYTPQDFIALIGKHRIKYHEKKLGQLFCNGSASQITDLLQKECDAAGVKIVLSCDVHRVEKQSGFIVKTSKDVFQSESLVIATGGLSIPKMGATNFGYGIAKEFNVHVVGPLPALVPLTCEKEFLKHFGDLSGISLDVAVRCNDRSFRENLLFTHRGLSGPAILQISSYWDEGDEISINLFPDIDVLGVLTQNRTSKMELDNVLAQFLPKRFTEKWCAIYGPSKPMNQFNQKEIEDLAAKLQNWKIVPVGTEGFDKAEVTRGGIDTEELSSKTMECKKVPGLYFIGEVVDVTGHLGGHNFQWAWASGFAAGQYV